MADPSYTAIQLMIVGTLSRKYGWEFHQKLRANDIMIVQGHQQVPETLARGERLLAAEGADQYAWVDRKAGHQVQSILPADGTFAIAAPTAIIKGSPHPHAARAFAEFMIGDALQKLFPGEGIHAARADIEPPPATLRSEDRAHRRRLRGDREGGRRAQEALQRDLSVAGLAHCPRDTGSTPAKVRKSTIRKSPVTRPVRVGRVGRQRRSAAR